MIHLAQPSSVSVETQTMHLLPRFMEAFLSVLLSLQGSQVNHLLVMPHESNLLCDNRAHMTVLRF